MIKSLSSYTLVFSTLVEVFPSPPELWRIRICLLHARGGVSVGYGFWQMAHASSPRSWRCFSTHWQFATPSRVFSTLVEVFLDTHPGQWDESGLLHARGGVSH